MLLQYFAFILSMALPVQALPKPIQLAVEIPLLLEKGIPVGASTNGRVKTIGFLVRNSQTGTNYNVFFQNALFDQPVIVLDLSKYRTPFELNRMDIQLTTFFDLHRIRGNIIMIGEANPAVESALIQKLSQILISNQFVDINKKIVTMQNFNFLLEVSRHAELTPGVSIASLENDASHSMVLGRHQVLLFIEDDFKKHLSCQAMLDTPTMSETDRMWEILRDIARGG